MVLAFQDGPASLARFRFQPCVIVRVDEHPCNGPLDGVFSTWISAPSAGLARQLDQLEQFLAAAEFREVSRRRTVDHTATATSSVALTLNADHELHELFCAESCDGRANYL